MHIRGRGQAKAPAPDSYPNERAFSCTGVPVVCTRSLFRSRRRWSTGGVVSARCGGQRRCRSKWLGSDERGHNAHNGLVQPAGRKVVSRGGWGRHQWQGHGRGGPVRRLHQLGPSYRRLVRTRGRGAARVQRVVRRRPYRGRLRRQELPGWCAPHTVCPSRGALLLWTNATCCCA